MPQCKVMTDDYKIIIDTILQEDLIAHKKQRHTSKRIFQRLVDDHKFQGAYRTVFTYVKTAKENLRQDGQTIAETFDCLEHTSGEAQIDFCTYQVYKDELFQDYFKNGGYGFYYRRFRIFSIYLFDLHNSLRPL